MENFILDTNLFFNMEAGFNLGKKTEEVVMNLTKIIKKLKEKKRADFYTTPSVIQEFLSFFDDREQLFIKDFIASINIKSPDYLKIQFPAKVFYKLIKDIRGRSYKGLNLAEEEIKKAGQLMQGTSNLAKKDFEIKIGALIKNMRERYRQATRVGFLDSTADLDLIVLTKEIDGFLVSTDEGVIEWAREFGVREMPSFAFEKRLRNLGEI